MATVCYLFENAMFCRINAPIEFNQYQFIKCCWTVRSLHETSVDFPNTDSTCHNIWNNLWNQGNDFRYVHKFSPGFLLFWCGRLKVQQLQCL